jgi:hypothetical protein
MAVCYETDVLQLLKQTRPASLLSIGPHARDFFSGYLVSTDCDFVHLTLQQASDRLPTLPRFQFALIAAIEQLEKAPAAALIARLRDVHAERFAVVAALAPGAANAWTAQELLASGLYRVADYPQTQQALYQFDIAQYKQTPDWLNSDYWANPELFNKYRW